MYSAWIFTIVFLQTVYKKLVIWSHWKLKHRRMCQNSHKQQDSASEALCQHLIRLAGHVIYTNCVLLSLFGWENSWLVVFVILGRQCSLQTVCRCLRPNLHNPNLESWEGNGGGKVYGGKRERSQTEFSANGVVVDTFAQQEKGHWFNSLCRHRVWRKGNPIKSITLPPKAKTFWCSYSTVIISANLKVGGSPMHPLVCEST